MKIVYILDSLFNAGVQHHVYQLAMGLSGNDQIKIVCLEEKGPLAESLEKKGIEVVAMNTPAIYKPDSIKKIFLLSRWLKKWQPDVVQTFLLKANIMGVLAAKLAGVKIILSGRTNMGYATKKSHYIVLKMLDYLTTGTVICSKAILNNTASKGKIPVDKLHLIYNGIDPDKFLKGNNDPLKSKLGLPKNKKIVGIVANIRPVKGYEHFVSSAAIIIKQKPETHFLVVGNIHDNQYYFDQLQDQIRQADMEGAFTFLHDCQQIPEVLGLMDIAVLSSLSEGFSITLLEYMAAQKPVVVTDVGGNSEAVIQNHSGILVPPSDKKALSSAVIKLISQPEFAGCLAENARKRVVENFSRSVIFDDHKTLYRRLMRFNSHQPQT
jgi:glycosyltransferase involved in cell wall biosynthesis